ncbi:MAG: hypothetical protein JSV92_04420 [archaeon]|nr:MAG: hypothetical protein JSV92_04420 [archaeon]
MKKGLAPIIIEIILILIVVALGTSYFYWNQGFSETFEESTRERTESEMRRSGSDITIVNVARKEIGVKNTGKFSIDIDLLSFYLNGTQVATIVTDPIPVPATLNPAQIAIFEVTTVPPDLEANYTVRVASPDGAYDEVFAEMNFTI